MLTQTLTGLNVLATLLYFKLMSLYFETNQRHYRLILEQDLFDDWVVLCVYGSRHSKLGNMKKYPYQSFEEAYSKLVDVIKVRYKHSYKIKKFTCCDLEFSKKLYRTILITIAASSYLSNSLVFNL